MSNIDYQISIDHCHKFISCIDSIMPDPHEHHDITEDAELFLRVIVSGRAQIGYKNPF
jgi:hypothetical protein